MNKRQIIAIVSAPILTAIMYPIFHALADAFTVDRIAWYLGLVIYWLIWGVAFPFLIIGKEEIRNLVKPQKPNKKVLLLVSIPLILTIIGRFIPGRGYEKESVWIFLLLLSSAFFNGFFEEVLWRGVYAKLFPNSIFYRMIWPSLWFAIWHYAPGSILSGNVAILMIGAGVFGLYLSYLTKKTNTLWWSIIVHVLVGIIMVL